MSEKITEFSDQLIEKMGEIQKKIKDGIIKNTMNCCIELERKKNLGRRWNWL